MKKLASALSVGLWSSFFYLTIGLSVHKRIVGEPPGPLYYHNIAVGVIIGTLVVVHAGLLLLLLFKRTQLVSERFNFYGWPMFAITLLGIFYSTGVHGGSLLTPSDFWFLVPVNLVVLALWKIWVKQLIEENKTEEV